MTKEDINKTIKEFLAQSFEIPVDEIPDVNASYSEHSKGFLFRISELDPISTFYPEKYLKSAPDYMKFEGTFWRPSMGTQFFEDFCQHSFDYICTLWK